jgi:hypothetical protein
MRYTEFAASPDDCSTVSLLVPEDGVEELDRIRAAHNGPTKVASIQPLGSDVRGCRVVIACLNPWYANDLMMEWLALHMARAFSAECKRAWAAEKAGA